MKFVFIYEDKITYNVYSSQFFFCYWADKSVNYDLKFILIEEASSLGEVVIYLFS